MMTPKPPRGNGPVPSPINRRDGHPIDAGRGRSRRGRAGVGPAWPRPAGRAIPTRPTPAGPRPSRIA